MCNFSGRCCCAFPTKFLTIVRLLSSEFLAPGAPCEVNIDGKTMERTQQELKAPSRFTFDPAAEHVYALLLKKDCYPRFRRSEMYKQLLASGVQPSAKKRYVGVPRRAADAVGLGHTRVLPAVLATETCPIPKTCGYLEGPAKTYGELRGPTDTHSGATCKVSQFTLKLNLRNPRRSLRKKTTQRCLR